MKKLWSLALFVLLATPAVWADTQETTVFRAAMSPDNEVPVISAPGNTGFSTITVRVTRDTAGNINAATVIFDIDYTVPVPTTFSGLHIHNALPGTSGGVVINTGVSGNNPISAVGSGHITRVVNYASTDTAGLAAVTGLLNVPENYYVNIHSLVQPGGLMRVPLLRTSLTLRPAMSPLQEVPSLTVDAEGAAAVQILVNRNNAGAITSGTVTFDVDYRLPASSTITGLHIHNAAAGSNGPIVIDSGVNSTTRSVATTTGRGNIFRTADIDSSNTAGLAVLTSLMSDPTAFYINMHTAANPGGIMRGQLSKDVFAFFGQMTAAEENPPTATTGVADTMTFVRVARDNTGNIVSGSVSFNVSYSGLRGPVIFSGLHIHNAPIGVNGSVVINTGLNATNSGVDDDGVGSISREVIVDATTPTALTAVKGLLANPELYYVNIHTTRACELCEEFPTGAVRSQLAREVYHYKALMSPANEVPPVTSAASATGWITVKVSRDGNGVINGGQVTFDVDVSGTDTATTYTGLHIHTGSAGVNGGVVINTGISGPNPVVSSTGTLNITRVVNIGPTDTNSLAMLSTLINNPDLAYVNIHTTTNGGGLARSQMLPVVNYVPQIAGGGEWISSVQITNPSATAAVRGIVDTYQSNGSAMSGAFVDPNVSFLIPPGGSTTVNVHNKGTLTTGYVRVYSSANVTLSAAYNFPAFSTTATLTPVTARMVTVPVNVGSGNVNTGIAVLAVTPGTLLLTLRNDVGLVVPGGSRSIDVVAGQHIVGFVRDLLPDVTLAQFTGNLTIESRPAAGTGTLSAIAIQFNGTLSGVTVTPLP